MEHSNVQIYFIKVSTPREKSWVVGTRTQRGFTEEGVKEAMKKVQSKLPNGWKAEVITVTPLSSLL